MFLEQSFTKYLRLKLVFIWNRALREKFAFCFSIVFTSIKKFSFQHEDWTLDYNSLEFSDFPAIFLI